jgi:hypothetical protein
MRLKSEWIELPLCGPVREWLDTTLRQDVQLVQPYQTVYARAKFRESGRTWYKLIFGGIHLVGDKVYRLPVCYVLDCKSWRFRGTKMHYHVTPTQLYSQVFPIYTDRVQLGNWSECYRGRVRLLAHLDQLYTEAQTNFLEHFSRRSSVLECLHRERMAQLVRRTSLDSATSNSSSEEDYVIIGRRRPKLREQRAETRRQVREALADSY